MSQGSRWLDGFATTATLLGMRPDEIAAALPEGSPIPPWLATLDRTTGREARTAILAAQIAKMRAAVLSTRPGWR